MSDSLTQKLLRRSDYFLRNSKTLGSIRINQAVDVESAADSSITHLQILVPAQDDVSLGVTARDTAFLQACKYYREGFYARPPIFTCEVSHGYCHIGTGLICTRDFKAINDSQMKYRMDLGPPPVGNQIYRPFKWFKPLHAPHRAGTFATIGNVYQGYWGHWLFDCLPRLLSLEKASAGEHVVLLVPDDLAASWCDSLDCVLPPNFEIQRLPANSWVQVDRMLLASYPTGRANNHMPPKFSNFVRRKCFTKFGLPPENMPSERIYISRARTRHRRILNEDALVRLLGRYGFKSVTMEDLSFKQQVGLFHRAEIMVTADGSNCANMLFAGKIPVFILYPTPEPNTHWFTAAKGLGQEHYFVAGDGEPHADFQVDLAAVERVLVHEMRIAPVVMD